MPREGCQSTIGKYHDIFGSAGLVKDIKPADFPPLWNSDLIGLSNYSSRLLIFHAIDHMVGNHDSFNYLILNYLRTHT